jgi:hypothetical protein
MLLRAPLQSLQGSLRDRVPLRGQVLFRYQTSFQVELKTARQTLPLQNQVRTFVRLARAKSRHRAVIIMLAACMP